MKRSSRWQGSWVIAAGVLVGCVGCASESSPSRQSQSNVFGTAGSFATAGVTGTAAANGGTAGVVASTAGIGGTAGSFAGASGAAGWTGIAGSDGLAGAGGVAGAGGSAGMDGAAGIDGAAGAAAGAGGSDGNVVAKQSAGCGIASPPAGGTIDVDVNGTQRQYIVELPTGYDKTHPYRLIFAFHYLNGTASGIRSGGYYGLQSRAENSAIFVAPQGIDNAWPNTGGRDVAFTQVMLDYLRANYCIDQERIFSVGFSYGAIMSNTVGCVFGDVFRAIAPMAGSGPRSTTTCKGQIAVWLSHGTSDTTVSFSSGEASRDHWVEANHCTSTTTAVGSCVAYEGCDAGYPVHWCEFSGGHTRPSFAPDAIWSFFEQF